MPKSQGHGQALVLSQEQADAVIQACSPTLRAVFSFTRSTAARISEVLSLKFENVTGLCVQFSKFATFWKLFKVLKSSGADMLRKSEVREKLQKIQMSCADA